MSTSDGRGGGGRSARGAATAAPAPAKAPGTFLPSLRTTKLQPIYTHTSGNKSSSTSSASDVSTKQHQLASSLSWSPNNYEEDQHSLAPLSNPLPVSSSDAMVGAGPTGGLSRKKQQQQHQQQQYQQASSHAVVVADDAAISAATICTSTSAFAAVGMRQGRLARQGGKYSTPMKGEQELSSRRVPTGAGGLDKHYHNYHKGNERREKETEKHFRITEEDGDCVLKRKSATTSASLSLLKAKLLQKKSSSSSSPSSSPSRPIHSLPPSYFSSSSPSLNATCWYSKGDVEAEEKAEREQKLKEKKEDEDEDYFDALSPSSTSSFPHEDNPRPKQHQHLQQEHQDNDATFSTGEEVERPTTHVYPCELCGRSFNQRALSVHSRVCQKVFISTRPRFDSRQRRTQGTEAEKYVKQQPMRPLVNRRLGGVGGGTGSAAAVSGSTENQRMMKKRTAASAGTAWTQSQAASVARLARCRQREEQEQEKKEVDRTDIATLAATRRPLPRKQVKRQYITGTTFSSLPSVSLDSTAAAIPAAEDGKKWLQQSQGFRAMLKANRRVAQAEKEGRPVSPTLLAALSSSAAAASGMQSQSLVPCPHCLRKYNEQAAARHIPKCKDIRAKPSRLHKGQGLLLGARHRVVKESWGGRVVGGRFDAGGGSAETRGGRGGRRG